MTKRLTARQIEKDLAKGVRKIRTHPCSLCRANDPRVHYHGSDFGKCIRKLQYQKLNGDRTFSDQDLLSLHDGHVHEAAIIELLQAAGHTIVGRATEEDPKGDELIQKVQGSRGGSILVAAHTDGILLQDEEGRDILIECKAVRRWSWRNKFSPSLPKNYVAQMRTYMLMHRLAKGFMIVKNRCTSEHRVFNVRRNDDQIRRKVDQIIHMESMTHDKFIVDCEGNKSEQKFCDACDEWGRP